MECLYSCGSRGIPRDDSRCQPPGPWNFDQNVIVIIAGSKTETSILLISTAFERKNINTLISEYSLRFINCKWVINRSWMMTLSFTISSFSIFYFIIGNFTHGFCGCTVEGHNKNFFKTPKTLLILPAEIDEL